MTAGKRMALAGACIVTGVFVGWTINAMRRPPAEMVLPAAVMDVPADQPAPGNSVLWVLSIGVSEYAGTDSNLQFADADARAIAAVLQGQGDGPLYRAANTLLITNNEVSRESILASMDKFLGRAGPDDVVVIFVAGHGVQDRVSGSYYFLPSGATAENLLTAGLRMSDFDEMVRVVRRQVRAVILMLDTCHAGALRLASPDLRPADELPAVISVREGVFLLAATKPGEDSKEEPELAHGAFTYALLEGLEGAADAHGDGVLSVSDLFGYVARRVPQLTEGEQHPYTRVEGTDLVFAAARGTAMASPATPVRTAIEPRQARAAPNTIGVMEFRDLRATAEHEWIGKALRVALNTELSKVRVLRVYSPELIDRTAASRRSDQLTVAQYLGIRKLLTGSFHVVGNTLRIDAEIIDAASGVQEASDSVQGDLGEFFGLQKQLVFSMLRRLRVELSPAEGASIQSQSNTNVDAYRLLLESEGIVEQSAPPLGTPPPPPPTAPQSRRDDGRWKFALVTAAYAAESSDPAVEVQRLLDAYRGALERKDLDALAALYRSFSVRQREALRAYLDNATGLQVELADIAIEPRGPDMAVTYTRRDRFVDKESAKPQLLEVRLTKILVRDQGTWKFSSTR